METDEQTDENAPPPPAPRRSLALRVLWGIASVIGWSLVFVVCLVVSLVYHASLPALRREARPLLVSAVSGAIAGDLEIEEIEQLDTSQVIARGVVIRDPSGREVIRAERVTLWPNLRALILEGRVHVSAARLERGQVRLYVSGEDGQRISLVDALQGTGPPSNDPNARASPIPIAINGIRLIDVDVAGDVPNYPGLHVEIDEAYGQIVIDRSVVLRIHEGEGRMLAPYRGVTEIDQVMVRFDTNWEEGLRAYVRAHRGQDRAHARILLNRPEHPDAPDLPEDERPLHMSLEVHADRLSARTLEELGVPGSESLSGVVGGDLRLVGPVHDLVIAAYLHHRADLPGEPEPDSVAIRGRIAENAPIVIEGSTRGFDLQRLVRSAPDIEIGGEVQLEIVTDPEDPQRARFHVDALPLEVVGVAVPSFVADGAIEEGAVVIEQIRAPHLGGVIEGRGRVEFDGSLDVHMDLAVGDIGGDPNVQRFAPGARGALSGSIDLDSGPGGTDLVLDFDLVALNFRFDPIRARRLAARGRARGELSAPRVHVDATADELRISDVPIGDARATVDGGPSRYQIAWRSEGERIRALEVEAHASPRGDGWAIEAPEVLADIGTGPLRGAVRGVRILPNEIRIGDLQLGAGEQSVGASARIRTDRGSSEARLDLEGIELSHLGDIMGMDLGPLVGTAEAHLQMEGTFREPELTLEGTIAQLSWDRLRNANITYAFEYVDGTLTTLVHGDFGSRGGLDIEGPIQVPSFQAFFDPQRFVEDARLRIHAYANHLNLAFLLPLLGDEVQELGVTGRIGGEIALIGSLTEPVIEPAVIIFDRLALPGWSEVRVKIQAAYREDHLHLERIWLADASAELAMIEADALLPLDNLPTDLPSLMNVLEHNPWTMSARIAPRLLSQWPRPLNKTMPRGIVASGIFFASGGDGRPAQADLTGRLEWIEAANDIPCAAELRPAVHITAQLRDERTEVQLAGLAEGDQVAVLTAAAHTPVDNWLLEGSVGIPEPDLTLSIAGLPLESLPWTCGRAAGVVNGNVSIASLLGQAPRVEGALEIEGLRVSAGLEADRALATRPYHVAAAFRTEGEQSELAAACAIIAAEGQLVTPFNECGSTQLPEETEVVLRGALPIHWEAASPIPELDLDRDLDLTMLMSDAHLEPVLALVPQVTDADVIADGRVLVHGTLDELELAGGLALRDGTLEIVSLGQHLHDLHGVLQLNGDRIVIPERDPLIARDGDGSVVVFGEVGLAGVRPSFAYLTTRPSAFPVRQEGAVLATLSGEAEARVTIEADGMEGAIAIGDLTVRLPEQMAGSVQPLEDHPDLLVVGEVAPALMLEAGPGYPIHMRIDASRPFWVRRNDFAVQVVAELDVTYLEPELFIGGFARLERGYFEVFGKRFEVQRGGLTFDGGSELNPAVDLVAVYQLPGQGGSNVTVTASGRLSPLPQIEFSSTDATDQGEIIALLVSGRRAIGTDDPQANRQQASEQAASFLSGLTAGILTLGLRQQFGDVVPLLAIETGSALGDTRIRAGFNAQELIPDFMREVVVGAYIEGFVTTTAGQTAGGGSGGVGGGVRFDLQFPFNFVGSGTYVPPTSWGVDLLWEP